MRRGPVCLFSDPVLKFGEDYVQLCDEDYYGEFAVARTDTETFSFQDLFETKIVQQETYTVIREAEATPVAGYFTFCIALYL